eukprot:457388_1
MTTLKKPLLSVNGGHGSVELKIGQEFDDDNFEVLTDDISFTAKVRLLLWKNFMIQCRRRPKSCCVKCCIPLFIMFVLVTLTFISTLQPHLNEDAYGLEFDYIISNTGDSADFTLLYPMNHILPWPDSNTNANQWIKYIICDPNRVTNTNGRDINPPSYLAIIYPNYNTSTNFQKLLTILNKNYGTNNYLQEFEQNTIASNTWYTYEYFMNQSHISSSPFSSEPKSEQFVYVNCYNQSSDTTFVNFTAGSLLKFFNTEKELNDYITDAKYGNTGYNFNNTNSDATRPIGAAIVFNTIGDNNGMDWEYTFRFNSSVIPQTDTLIDKFTRNIDQLYYQSAGKYLEFSGFIQLQNWLDQAIMEYMVNISNANMDTLNIMSKEYSKGLFMFPTKSYEESTYWNYIGQTFPFILFIMFCYPIITVLSILVEEKRSKIKEGMKMMGATTTAYWTSWTIWFFIEFTGMALLVSILGSGFGVFRYTDFGIVFLWFWLFCLSSAAFAMMFSTIFDNPKTASLVGLIVFFAVLIGAQSHGSLDMGGKNGLCLLGPACFVISVDTLTQYETSAIGLNWDNINDEYGNFIFANVYIMMFIDIIIYLLLTIYLDQVFPSNFGQKQVFYFFLLPSYWRKKFGCNKNERSQQLKLQRTMSENLVTSQYEQLPDHYKDTDAAIAIRKLSKFFKSFGLTEHTRKEVRAVDNISLDMYKGEVFCLLGHNGAGKTTTIGMLTGLLDATHGSAYILQNDVTNPNTMSEIRKHLGVCPQHDVLFKRLTVREHLQLFCRLKGVPSRLIKQEVDQTIDAIGIKHKANDFPPSLSGGEKRKLSLGIALIGGSKIVFLDEPTSGMDPQSRRVTWDLIAREKRNRCIILTTHFMDEAEILADRIGIMVHGKLMCCGSSFYLKQQYDVGYALSLQLSTALNINQTLRIIDEVIREYVKDDSAKCIGQAATEILYRISFESNKYLPILFRYIDKHKKELGITKYAISATTLEEVFRTINDATLFSREESVSTKDRRDSSSNYNKYGDYKPVILNKNDEDSKISVDSDTNTTKNSINETQIETNDNVVPEEERSQLSKQSELESITIDGTTDTGTTDGRTGGTTQTQTELVGEDTVTEPKHKRQASFLDGYDAVNEDETFKEYYKENYVNIGDRSCIPCLNLYFWRHVWLQIWKRTLNAKRDAKTFWCQCMIPSIFILWGLATTNVVWWEDQPEYYLDTQDWIMNPDISDGGILTIPYNAYDNSTRPSYYQSSSFEDLLLYDANNSYNKYKSYMTTAYQENTSLPEWQDILYNTRFDDIQPRYLSLYMSQFLDPDVLIIGANASAFHSIPIGLNLASDFIAQTISGNHSDPNFISNSYIKTASHPFPRTASQDVLIEAVEGFFTAITLAVGLIFVPGAYIALLVDERTNMVKHQQLVSGMDVISYWTGNFIFDTTTNIFPATLVLVYVALFDVELFLGEAAFATWFVVIMYGFAVVPFTYLASLFFSSPGTAQALTIFLYYSAAVIAMIAAWVMDLIPDDDLNNTNQTLKIIYRFFPPFCLSDSFRGISTRNIKLLWGKSMEPLAWEVTGRNLLIMFIESCGYFSLLLLLEYLSKSPAFLSWIGKINMIDDAYKGQYYKEENQLDDDVVKEQRKLKKQIGFNDNELLTDISESKDNDDEKKVEQNNINIIQYDNNNLGDDVIEPIEIHGLRKVYRGSYKRPPTVAVQDLWYTVKKGQVFGFLGMNGAGKTTTISMLTGLLEITSGTAWIMNNNISDSQSMSEIRKHLGVCPQHDVLWDKLTVTEHLWLFARLKGVSENRVDKEVDQILENTGLSQDNNNDKFPPQMSGGQRRKLSLGIALIGGSQIVFLDEPTSGMDPQSRRITWDLINKEKKNRCIILTTHFMDEA